MVLRSKGGWADDKGWLLECLNSSDFESLRFVTWGDGRTLYKTFQPIIDRKDHFFGMVFRKDGLFCDGIWHHRIDLPDGATCHGSEQYAFPVAIVIDGYWDRIWTSFDDPCRDVAPSAAEILSDWSGTVHDFSMYHGDITLQDIIDYYKDTKGDYAI